jgi:hypothetical protein
VKQHITDEQYCELAEDKRIKFAHWLADREAIKLIDADYIDVAEATTIGRMIEFLDGTNPRTLTIQNEDHEYLVDLDDDLEGEWHYELADALWKAVCESLEQNKVASQ